MQTIARLIRRLFARKTLRVKPDTLILGSGVKGTKVLSMILAATKPDAILARQNNYRRSVKRILDACKN